MSDVTPKISLCMIVKNEAENLPTTLASVFGIVDEIIIVDTGSTDDTKKIAESLGAKVFDFEWENNFAKARNFSFSKATHDWVLWLDDDVLVNGEEIKPLLQSISPTVGGIMMDYHYAHDEEGNCFATHKKVRLCRNDGTFMWKKPIHEDLVPVGAVEVMQTDKIYVKHLASPERVRKSSERNLDIALKEYDDNSKDPRVVFDLANAYLALGNYEEAIRKYLEYIPMSGWNEEIYIAYCRTAQCLLALNQLDEAANMLLRAVKTEPRYAESYRMLAHVSMIKGEWLNAEDYLKTVLMKEKPETTIVWNPFEYEVAPYYELAQVYERMNRVDEALQALKIYIEKSGGKQNGKDMLARLNLLKDEVDFRNSYVTMSKRVDEYGDINRIKSFLDSIPPDYASDPVLVRLRNKHFKKTESSGKDVVIYCGRSWEEWCPNSLKTGIGGSEEAVIRLSRELSGLGWKVKVYNSCGIVPVLDEGDFGVVTYEPFWNFNPEDKQDVFISWRNPNVFDLKINAKVKLLDLHDVPIPMDYSTKRLKEIDRIMVKSRFHRNLLPHIPDDKFAIIGHGVDFREFEGKNIPRNRHKAIYSSSYDRGLENLLDVWPEVLKEIPDARLDICYGWGLFDIMHAGNKVQMEWKQKMIEKMSQEGITEHGRISHEKNAELMLSSGVLAYPSHFEEIFCIVAAKAQMAGCVPVVGTSVNCLDEVVKIGVHVRGDMKSAEAKKCFAENLIKVMKDEKLQKKMGDEARRVALDTFSWKKVADEWIKLFV